MVMVRSPQSGEQLDFNFPPKRCLLLESRNRVAYVWMASFFSKIFPFVVFLCQAVLSWRNNFFWHVASLLQTHNGRISSQQPNIHHEQTMPFGISFKQCNVVDWTIIHCDSRRSRSCVGWNVQVLLHIDLCMFSTNASFCCWIVIER